MAVCIGQEIDHQRQLDWYIKKMHNRHSRKTAHELMLASGQSFTTSTPSKLAIGSILSPLKYEANLTRAKVFTKRKTTLANDAR